MIKLTSIYPSDKCACGDNFPGVFDAVKKSNPSVFPSTTIQSFKSDEGLLPLLNFIGCSQPTHWEVFAVQTSEWLGGRTLYSLVKFTDVLCGLLEERVELGLGKVGEELE